MNFHRVAVSSLILCVVLAFTWQWASGPAQIAVELEERPDHRVHSEHIDPAPVTETGQGIQARSVGQEKMGRPFARFADWIER